MKRSVVEVERTRRVGGIDPLRDQALEQARKGGQHGQEGEGEDEVEARVEVSDGAREARLDLNEADSDWRKERQSDGRPDECG